MKIEARMMKILLTAGALLVLFTALAPGALSDDSYKRMGWSKSGHEIKSIDMVKTITGTSGDTVTFQVPSAAITMDEGKVATMSFPTPLTGAYNLKYGGGYISMKGAKTSDIAVRPMDNATMNIAGASMVVSMKGIKVLSKDRDSFTFEYHKMGLVLPDGTAKEYYLDRPVKVSFSKDRMAVMIDAYPAIGDITSYAYTSNAKFPASSPPISIQAMRNAEATGRVQSIGTAPILRPSATPTPAPTVVPTATPVVTATPIASPTATPVVSPAPTATAEPTVVPTTTPVVVPVPTEVPTTTPAPSPTQVTAPVPSL